jgi:hypothetical protein
MVVAAIVAADVFAVSGFDGEAKQQKPSLVD